MYHINKSVIEPEYYKIMTSERVFMKHYNDLGFFDFEDFDEELSEEQLYAVNGGTCAGGYNPPSNIGNCAGGSPSGGGYNPPSYSGTCAGGAPGNGNDRASPPPSGKPDSSAADYRNPATWFIKYDIENNVIRVYNTDPETVQMALNDPYAMAVQLKADFKKKAGYDFPVSNGSLAAEVFLHAEGYKRNFITEHTGIADCGAGDKERIAYDTYAKIRGWDD